MSEQDGRFIEPSLGILEGEGAQQRTQAGMKGVQVWTQLPVRAVETPEGPAYFEQPMLQTPVWEWSIPAYFFAGGAAGGALALASAAQSADRRALRYVIGWCRWIGVAGITSGSALLIYDLGKPSRFLNMLRVFRPTSPLNVGTWLLTSIGPLAGASALSTHFGGLLRRFGDWAGYGAGVLGLPLAGYTGVVLADTAVPVWQGARRALPALFVASGMASAASLLEFGDFTWRENRVVRTFGLLGKTAELASTFLVDYESSRVKEVGQAFRRGRAGLLWNTAKVLSAASLALSLLPGRSRRKRIATGVLGVAGAVCMRFGIMEAGRRSAADPRASFRQQRAGFGGAEVTGRPAIASALQQRALEPPPSERALPARGALPAA